MGGSVSLLHEQDMIDMACVQCKLRPCDLVTLHRLMDPHLSFSQLDPGRILLHPAGHRLCRLQPPPCGVDSCVRRIWPLPCCHGLDHRLLPRLAVRACAERLAFLCMYSRAGAHNDPKQWLCYLMRPAMELHDARNWVMPAITAPPCTPTPLICGANAGLSWRACTMFWRQRQREYRY